MIVITGATGQLGQLGPAITERLLKLLPASRVGVSVRDVGKAASLEQRGVCVRMGNYGDAASLNHAFEGAEQVLLVSANSTGGEALRQHATAIDAARKAGARRILYTSHMGANPASLFAPMPDHAATEQLLQESGVPFTSLRNGFYASSAMQLMARGLQTGELAVPEDGPVSWTTHADLAEAAAIALTQEGSLDGLSPPLTGSQALTLAELAEMASEVTGRKIKRDTVPDDEFRKGLLARGLPKERADLFLGLFKASRKGEFARVDGTLERLLGRPPMLMRDFLAAELKAG